MHSNQTDPSDLINPKKKDKAWCLAKVKSLYGGYVNTGSGWCDRDAIHKRRMYANATQDISIYREKLKCEEKNTDGGDSPIDFTPLPLLVKLWQIIHEMITKETGTVDINAVDPISTNQKQEAQNRIRVSALLQEQFAALEAETGMSLLKEEDREVPTAPEELEMYLAENTKLSAERDLEDVVALVKTNSDYEEKLERLAKSLIIDGLGAYKTYTNQIGFLVTENIDSKMVIAPYSAHSNFDDMEYCGYVKYVENTKILTHLQKNEKLTFDDAKKVLEGCNTIGNDNTSHNLYIREEQPQINGVSGKSAVVCMYWKSIDRKVKGFRKDEYGNKKIVDLDDDIDELEKAQAEVENFYDKTLEETMENVYYSEWIMGTEYQMNYGLMHNQPRDAMFPETTRLPIRIEAPIMNDGVFQSFISLVLPLYEMIQLAWLKVQDNVARSIPKGLAVDVEKLQDIVMSGNTKLDPQKILEYFWKTGTIVYAGSTSGGVPPIQELENGISQSVITLNNLMLQWNQMLKEMSGINEAVDGSSPSSELGMGVMKQMVANTNSALSAYRKAMARFELNVVKDIVDLTPMAATENPKQFTVALGDRTTEFLKELKEPRSYGFKYTRNLSNKEWQEFLELAKSAINASPENGGITIADYLRIKDMESAKQAAATLKLLISRNQKEYSKAQQASIQANAEAQMQSAQAASQMKIQEETAIAQIKMQAMQMEYQLKMELEKLKGQFAIQKAQIEAEKAEEVAMIKADSDVTRAEEDAKGWIESAEIQGERSIEKTNLDNEVKLTIAGMNNNSKEKVASMKPKPTTSK